MGETLKSDASGVGGTEGSNDPASVVGNTDGESLAEFDGPMLFEADGEVLGSMLC